VDRLQLEVIENRRAKRAEEHGEHLDALVTHDRDNAVHRTRGRLTKLCPARGGQSRERGWGREQPHPRLAPPSALPLVVNDVVARGNRGDVQRGRRTCRVDRPCAAGVLLARWLGQTQCEALA
jgi:hypothetical protein